MSTEPTTRTHIVLPTRLLEQLDDLVGPRHRSEFIAEALTQSVQRARLQKALAAMKDWPEEEGSRDDELAEFAEAAAEIRRERHDNARERWLRENWLANPE